MINPFPQPAGTPQPVLTESLHGRDSQPQALTPSELQQVVGGIAIIGTLVRHTPAS